MAGAHPDAPLELSGGPHEPSPGAAAAAAPGPVPPNKSPGKGAPQQAPAPPPPASVTPEHGAPPVPPPAPETPPHDAPPAPPPAPATPTRDAPPVPPPAPATPTRDAPPVPPPAPATPTREAPPVPPPAPVPPPRESRSFELPPGSTMIPMERVSPTPPAKPPPAATYAAGCPGGGQQQAGTCAVATVRNVPSESPKKEYLTAVKAYEQQVGTNIVRGKMFIESLPAYAVPPDRRFSPTPGMAPPGMAPPGTECGYNMAMGMGPGQPCGYGAGMPMGGGYGPGMPMGGGYGQPMGGGYGQPMGGGYGQPMASGGFSGGPAQRSRDRLREFAERETAVDFAELARMGPQVKKLMDMGGQLDDIITSGNYARRSGSNAKILSGGGFARPPMSVYDAPPDYPGPADRYDGPPQMAFPVSNLMDTGGRLEGFIPRRGSNDRRFPGGSFGRQPMSAYDAPMRAPPDYPGPADRYDGPPPNRYDGPPPNPGSRGRRAFSGENWRSIREDHGELKPVSSKQQSMGRASDLLRKIREDIEEHCADDMLQKIHREVTGYESGEKEDVRRIRGGSLPQSRTTSPRSFRDDGSEARTTRRTSSPIRSFRDDEDGPRRAPSPRRRPSRRQKESSSSTSSSSDGKSRRSRSPRRRKKEPVKVSKSRTKRRSKSKTKKLSSSSSSSSSSGRKRGKGKSAKKKSSSSSSSSSSDVRKGRKGKGVEFVRYERISSESDLENIRKHCQAVAKSMSSTRRGSGCPVLNMLGIRSRERQGPSRPPSRNIVEPTYGGEEMRRSRNFGGEVVAYDGLSRPTSRNFGGEVVAYGGVPRPTSRNFGGEVAAYGGVSRPTSRNFGGGVEQYGGVDGPPPRNFGDQAKRMASGGSVYRYESQPSAFNRQ